MPKPIESSFAEKLSLGGSKMGRGKKKKKMKNRYVEPESDSSDSDEGIIIGTLTPRELDEALDMGLDPVEENTQGPMYDDDGSDSDEEIIRGTLSAREMDEAWEMGVDHLEDLLYRECEDVRIDGPKYANAAISYMRGKGHNLELVKPGAFESTWEEDEEVDMIHFNFRAKRADDPNAPVETYFGQLNDYWNGDLIVDCCVSLGKSAPPIHRRDTGWCEICDGKLVMWCEICDGKLVHHPVGGCEGIHWRHMTWVRWLYANCQVIFKE